MTYISTTLNNEQEAQDIAKELRFQNDSHSSNVEFINSLTRATPHDTSGIRVLRVHAQRIKTNWTLATPHLFTVNGVIAFCEMLTAGLAFSYRDTPSAQRIIENW